MADKKKKSSMKKLKDVNKDGKRNFADTFLGDLIGADGKAGIEKGRPGMKASLKGARREDGKADKTAKAAKSSMKSSTKNRSEAPTATSVKTPKVTTRTLSDTRGGRGDGKAETARRRLDSALDSADKALTRSKNPNDMTAANKKMQEELAGKTRQRKAKTSYSDKGNTPIERARKTKVGGKEPKTFKQAEWKSMTPTQKKEAREKFQVKVSSSGMAKGGMVKKGYAKGGMVKANCGASMKPTQGKKR